MRQASALVIARADLTVSIIAIIVARVDSTVPIIVAMARSNPNSLLAK